MARPFYPREDNIRQRKVSGIRFQLVNKDAGVEGDAAVAPEK
jgi:hypothetical protein